MIKVRCDGCQATFEMDERRIPKTGLRARCPKCGAMVQVNPPGAPPGDLPVPAAPPRKPGGAPRTLMFGGAEPSGGPTGGHTDLPRPVAPAAFAHSPKDSLDDLPAAASPGVTDLPSIARDAQAAGLPAVANRAANVGLPAVAKPGNVGLPAVRHDAARPGAPQRPPTPPPTPATAKRTPPPMRFDALDDLPVAASADNLPAPKPASVATDALDDPFAKGSVDLPSPRGAPDLPAVRTAADLPATKAGDDLPAIGTGKRVTQLGRVQLERKAVPIDDLASGAGLPSPATGSGLPSPSMGAGLPSPSMGAGLPSPSMGAGLPSPSMGAGLPSTAGGGTSLPTPLGGSALPLPFGASALPSPSSSAGLPRTSAPSALPPPPPMSGQSDAGFGELDLPLSDEPNVPIVSSSSVRSSQRPLPMPGDSMSPPDPGDLPLPPVPGEGKKRTGARGGMGFGEVDLGGESEPDAPPQSAPTDSAEFAEIPLERAAPRDDLPGGTVDTAMQIKPAPTVTGPRLSSAGVQRPVRPGVSKGLLIAIAVLGVVVIGGAALSLTPYGAFGTKYIDARLHGQERSAAAANAVRAAVRSLEGDEYGAFRRTLRSLDAQQLSTPNEPELAAFNTYAHYFALARFGSDSAIASRARALFDRMASLPAGTRYAAAARAARDLATGHAANTQRASRTDSATRDLVTMALLEGGDPTAALEAATAARTAHPSPRTRFLMARALFVSGDRAGARREAESLASEAPQHAGARLLLASILGETQETRERAITYAHDVEQLATAASADERVEAAVLVGQIEVRRDRITAAREAFDRALQIDPRSPAALVGAGTILYRQSSFTDALARFQAAQTADAEDIDAKLGIAMASISLNRPGDARLVLEPLVSATSPDARVHFWLARALVAMNELQAAERAFRESIRLDNSNLDSYTTLASLLFSMQRPEAAEGVLQDARAHVTDLSSIHRALGEGRAARGDLAGAERELREALAARADDHRSRFVLAQTLRRLRRFDESQRELEGVSRADPNYPGLLLERGLLAEARGDANAALETFRAALVADPQNSELTVRVAAALVATQQYAEAETMLSRFLVEHGNVAEAHYVLGRARLAQGNTTEAVRLLERATELDSTRADFRAYAAQANLERSQFSRALEHANQAVALDPNYARAFWVRGEVRVRQGAVREALLDANSALRLEPAFAPAMVTLAEADEALGHIPEAVILYQRAVAIEPNRGDWFARLGQFQADLGHAPLAVQALQRATSLGDGLNEPPAWLGRAHRQLGDLLRPRDLNGARRHYRRFLELTVSGPGVNEVRGILSEIGG